MLTERSPNLTYMKYMLVCVGNSAAWGSGSGSGKEKKSLKERIKAKLHRGKDKE